MICERFGWTLEYLDGADETRILPMVAALNMHGSLGIFNEYLSAHSVTTMPDSVGEMYAYAVKLISETDHV